MPDWMGSLCSIKTALIAFFKPAEGWQLPSRLIIRALQGAPLWAEHLVQIYFNGPEQNGKVLNVQPQWWHFYEISKVQKQINERFERSTNRKCDNKNSTLIYQFKNIYHPYSWGKAKGSLQANRKQKEKEDQYAVPPMTGHSKKTGEIPKMFKKIRMRFLDSWILVRIIVLSKCFNVEQNKIQSEFRVF